MPTLCEHAMHPGKAVSPIPPRYRARPIRRGRRRMQRQKAATIHNRRIHLKGAAAPRRTGGGYAAAPNEYVGWRALDTSSAPGLHRNGRKRFRRQRADRSSEETWRPATETAADSRLRRRSGGCVDSRPLSLWSKQRANMCHDQPRQPDPGDMSPPRRPELTATPALASLREHTSR